MGGTEDIWLEDGEAFSGGGLCPPTSRGALFAAVSEEEAAELGSALDDAPLLEEELGTVLTEKTSVEAGALEDEIDDEEADAKEEEAGGSMLKDDDDKDDDDKDDDEAVSTLEDDAAGAYMYTFRRLGPPHSSKALPPHAMLQALAIWMMLPAPRAFPQ